jgi:hypothetical protein
MFFVMTTVASERAEMIVDSGQGGEGGGLVHVVFRFAPHQVADSDGFIGHEGTQIRDEGLVSRTNARRVFGSGQENIVSEWVRVYVRRFGSEVDERVGDIDMWTSLCGHRFAG